MPEIAILEDERNLVRALTIQLEALGYTIRGYTDPVAALPELIANPPDVLLLNGRMPGMHGIDVFGEFRLHSQAPVIFISANAEKIEATLAAAGTPAEGYVAKPFFTSDLAELIAQFAKPNCQKPRSRRCERLVGPPVLEQAGLPIPQFRLSAFKTAVNCSPRVVFAALDLIRSPWLNDMASMAIHLIDGLRSGPSLALLLRDRGERPLLGFVRCSDETRVLHQTVWGRAHDERPAAPR